MMDKEMIVSILSRKGIINGRNIIFEPLKGGVSSDINMISDGVHTYVVKQALPKLKVQNDWYADVSRNINEQDFIQFMQSFIPSAVPEIFYKDSEHSFFVMEYLDDGFQNWKQQMLDEYFEKNAAKKAAELLAMIHLQSRGKEDIKEVFDKAANFYGLRIEPYLITTGNQHPDLKQEFLEEAQRLKYHQETLIHGDYSPKNIMIKGDRLIILDHEAAWYGDPTFDFAFLLNHLYLKMLYHYSRHEEMNDLTKIAYSAYMNKWDKKERNGMEERTGRLLLMLMLARVDGMSPVEYFTDKEAKFIRSFIYELLPDRIFSHSEINAYWKSKLKSYTF